MGHRARGLQRQRRRLVVLHPRPGSLADLPLGRGRAGRHQRRAPAAVLRPRPCGTSRTRSSRSASSASPTARATTARTSRSTTSSSTTCPPTPTSAGCTSTRWRRTRTPTSSRPTGPAPATRWSTSCSTPACSTATATSTSRSPTPRPGRTTSCAASTSTTAPPSRRRSTSCRRCGSATRGRSRPTPPDRRSPPSATTSPGPSTLSWGPSTSTPPADAELLFCDNESNAARLWGADDSPPYPKDGIVDHVVHGTDTVNPARTGTKVAAHVSLEVPAGASASTWLRLTATPPEELGDPFADAEAVVAERRADADEFYDAITPPAVSADGANVMRQALAGMLWSKQSYYFDVDLWLREHDAHPLRQSAAPRHPQRVVVPHAQPRRHLDARHVGVPVVRGVGPRLPLHPPGDGRPRLRHLPTRPDAVAGVPPPERPDPGLRVELRRRQPAGARLRHAVHAQRGREHGRRSTCRSCASRSPACCSTSRGG